MFAVLYITIGVLLKNNSVQSLAGCVVRLCLINVNIETISKIDSFKIIIEFKPNLFVQDTLPSSS